MTMFDLKFNEPMHVWLHADSATGAVGQALEVLSSHGVTVVEEYGGSGVGDWDEGVHESGFVIRADPSTATQMAVLIEIKIGRPVVITETD